VLARVGPRTAFASPQVLAVLGVQRGWAHVLHPSLPDHRGGWVALRAVRLRAAAWSIDVDLSERRAVLRRNGRVFRRFTVGIGASGTPTPTGRFGVTDRLRSGAATAYYGCCVVALNGHQPNISQRWQGGDRLAIHGTDRPATIGQAATLGCLHADEATMRMLMTRVPLGSTVTIHA
jgi:lipoprotein-anchoring transpeptidase ErfK/SrfK